MNPILYYFPYSPPSRCVLLLAQIIGIVFDAKQIDITKGEQMTESFLQMNPQHTVPTLVDDSFTLYESRAILTYLTDSYAKNETLYPHDLKARALVDSRMQFDLGMLYPRMFNYYITTMFTGTPPAPDAWTKLTDALGFFNEMLRDHAWAAGETYTLADLTLTVTVVHVECFGADLTVYPRIVDWLQRSKTVLQPYKYDDIMAEALQVFATMYNEKAPK